MFKFDKFPAKIQYEKLNAFDEVILEKEVEVFGYITCDAEIPLLFGDYKKPFFLISFRETDEIQQGSVCFLPVAEFNERFKDYKLVKDES